MTPTASEMIEYATLSRKMVNDAPLTAVQFARHTELGKKIHAV